MGDALPAHAPSSPAPIPHALRTFPRQVGDDNEIMLGEFMLLAILGNVPVLGSFIAITAAYHIKLGSRRPPSPPACHRALPGAAIALQ